MLIYGFPSTGKTTFARANNWFDTDYLLGKLRSTSTREEKARVAGAARLLLNNGYSGVTNLHDIVPSRVFYRSEASVVRNLMIARGDDPKHVESLDVEAWIENLRQLLRAEIGRAHV